MDRAHIIMHRIRQRKSKKTNYKVLSDGDLWEHFERAVEAKGVHAARITKVKGHVSQEQGDAQQCRAADKRGNDKADEAADVGTQLFGKNVTNMADFFHTRHHRYTNLMLDVAKHIVEGYLIHRKLADIRETQEEKEDRRATYKPISYPSCDKPSNLKVLGVSKRFTTFSRKHTCAEDVQHFLGSLKAQHTEDPSKAASWLELYILYRSRGYSKPIKDDNNKVRARATVDMQLNRFKSTIRGLSKRLSVTIDDRLPFEPINVTHERFSTLGISGKHPAIHLQLDLDDATQDHIGDCLIKLGHHISGPKLAKFKAGRLLLPTKKLNLRGRAGWDSKLGPPAAKAHRGKASKTTRKDGDTTMSPAVPPQGICVEPIPLCWPCAKGAEIGHNDQQPVATGACESGTLVLINETPNVPTQPHAVLLQCPSCGKRESNGERAFSNPDLDHKIKCDSCRAYTKIHQWTCPCQKPWHTCPTHMDPLPQIGHPKARHEGMSSKRKISQGNPMSYTDLVRLDIKRARRENQRDTAKPVSAVTLSQRTPLALSPGMLSQKLQDRFAHLFKSKQ